MTGIYKITSPTGKVYIGQSVDIKRRFRAYKTLRCEKQPMLYNSLVKHGRDKHLFEVVYELPIDASASDFDKYERFFIAQYKEAGVLLMNSTDGGSNGRHSEETKMKLRMLAKGRKHTEQTRSKISNAIKGRPNSEIAIQLLIKRNSGRIVSDTTRGSQRQKMIGRYEKDKNPFYGKYHTAKTKTALSARRKIPVTQFSLDGLFLKEWPSAKDASDAIGACRVSITACCRGKAKTCFGFIWKYKNKHND